MHLLVAIDNNLSEWEGTLQSHPHKPRLPLPYAFGAAFYQRGHSLSAIDFSRSGFIRVVTANPGFLGAARRADKPRPGENGGRAVKTYETISKNGQNQGRTSEIFKRIYPCQEWRHAMNGVDTVLFWTNRGLYAIWKQIFLKPPRRKVILASYLWKLFTIPYLNQWDLGLATRISAYAARGIVLMTEEQCRLASKRLPPRIPVIQLTLGVDTGFYRTPSHFSEVPENFRSLIDRLLRRPYALMLGDQQRCDRDALKIATQSRIHFVRILQEHKTADWFRGQVEALKLSDRFFIFEKVSYLFLRFLLQHASAYAGLVDSSWQPAGWTVAGEALASGLPIVVYEGLVSRELERLGAGEFLHVVQKGDTQTFQTQLESIVASGGGSKFSCDAQNFAAKVLDLEPNGEAFVKQIEAIVSKEGS